MSLVNTDTERIGANPDGPADTRTRSVTSEPHSIDPAEVVKAFAVDPDFGLSENQVIESRACFGTNELQTPSSRSRLRILFDQFANLIIALLAVAALIAWATGDHIEAIAILVVLLINALVGLLMEWQASLALAALRRETHISSRVRREGRELKIHAEELVPGDIIILNAGDRVPADARLLEAASLRTEESALTGESTTVDKTPLKVKQDALLAERNSMLYLGTIVAAGRAVAVVTAIGDQTELGRIGRLVALAPDESTPLKRKLDELGRRLVYFVLVTASIVMVTGWLRGKAWWLMAEVGISLAVAAVPEALPAVTTIILALGVIRMAREHAIVRRLSSVETLGSTTIICTDKTGTLTENRMTVCEYQLADGKKVVLSENQPADIADNELLERAVRVSVLCNEASADFRKLDDMHVAGDPTEVALLVAARMLGMDVAHERIRFPKLWEHPFDAATMRMTTTHQSDDQSSFAALKGAPAVVLDACTSFADGADTTSPLDDEARMRFLLINREMANRALRVLALGEKQFRNGEQKVESGYTFLGFLGMIDPPRRGVAEAIRATRAAGIRVVMLTGDQINTARAIARELRLAGDTEPKAMHAHDLAGADHKRLAKLARVTDVFARVSPEDKLRIVDALKQSGEVVAVTGDGVNDAPALKRADIGVAMGMRGTEVSKEAADLVLADDNFATIVQAIEGGRTIYTNIIKFVHLMFSKNLGAVLAIFAAIAFGWGLPLLPLQILWINLVTDIFPALALAFEPAAKDVMRCPPRSTSTSLLSRPFFVLILWQALVLASIILAAYLWAIGAYGEGAHARTIALLALVGVQLGHLFNCRSQSRSFVEGLFDNPYIWLAAGLVIALQLLAVYFHPLASVLGTVPPNQTDWYVTGLTVVSPIIVVETTKLYTRRHAKK